MTVTKLKESDFVDLYIGENYAEIKGLVGYTGLLMPVPANLTEDVIQLQEWCIDKHRMNGRSEFSFTYDTRLYRATVLHDRSGQPSLAIRQTPAGIRPFIDVPLSTPLRKSVEQKNATGLFLIAGEMASGKTTTAASVLQHRLALTGQLGVAIEDPPETMLQGRHGAGRCIQLEVTENDGYASAIRRAYRMGASAFLLGEIRDGQTAHEVLKASLSMFVVSTIHAPSIIEALERYVMFCEEISPIAKANIASTLYVIAHQKMRINIDGNGRNLDITGVNLRNSTAAGTLRAKIAAGQFQSLSDHFSSQNYDFED